MVVATSIWVAGLWVLMVTPETAVGAPPEGKGGGKGDDKVTTIYFDVFLGVEESGNHNGVLLWVDEYGNPVFGDPDIFMICGSGIEGRIASGAGGTNIDRMIVNRPSPLIDVTSVIELLEDQSCFAELLVNGSFVAGGKGTLLIELPDRSNDEMTVTFSFRAKDTNGKDVTYSIFTVGMLMDLDGESGAEWGDRTGWTAAQDAVNDGTVDPTVIPNFFVQVAAGTPWTLSKPYGSEKFACKGTGTFEWKFGIRITNPRLNHIPESTLCSQ